MFIKSFDKFEDFVRNEPLSNPFQGLLKVCNINNTPLRLFPTKKEIKGKYSHCCSIYISSEEEHLSIHLSSLSLSFK